MLSTVPVDDLRAFENLDAVPYAFERDDHIVQWICALAGESPTARLLLKLAMTTGWTVQFSDLGGSGFMLDASKRALILDHFGFMAGAIGRSSYFRNAMFLSFVRGLRALWQVQKDPQDSFPMYRPDSILMKKRVEEADSVAVSILIAWELRGEGHADVWRNLLGSDDGDMAMVFTRAMEKDPGGFYDGSILARTFCQWYADPVRVATRDSLTLQAMDGYLRQGKGQFGDAPLTEKMVDALSILPGGRSYLQGMGETIIRDPFFVCMNDEINESHLFQIVYDSRVVMVGGVPFRDQRLARKIFPTETSKTKN